MMAVCSYARDTRHGGANEADVVTDAVGSIAACELMDACGAVAACGACNG